MRGVFFHMPYIAGTVYAPGPQPFSPGVSHMPWDGHQGLQFCAMPWPNAVRSINALANNSGQPRERAGTPVVNRLGPLPFNNLFIAGTVSKSKG